MLRFVVARLVMCAVATCALAGAVASAAMASTARAYLPTGQGLTPTAAPGAMYQRMQTDLRPDGNADVNGAVSTALSLDGSALLFLASGYNTGFFTTTGRPIDYAVPEPLTGRRSTTITANAQWVFVYDLLGRVPVVRQRINVPNTYCGLSWASDSRTFMVSGGPDDRVYAFTAAGSKARNAANQTYRLDAPEFLLGLAATQWRTWFKSSAGCYAASGTGEAQSAFLGGGLGKTTETITAPQTADCVSPNTGSITYPEVDFSAGDAPLSVAQNNTYKSSSTYSKRGPARVSPVAGASLSEAFNTSGLPTNLTISNAQLCGISKGTIKNWNLVTN